jgi:aromatic ring-opening dioxygenase catalytic subunit (LigB family)
MNSRFPTIFVSHGAPSILIEDSPARDFLRHLGKDIGRPKAIVCVSAHWTTPEHLLPLFVSMGAGKTGRVLHDSYTYGVISMAGFSWD